MTEQTSPNAAIVSAQQSLASSPGIRLHPSPPHCPHAATQQTSLSSMPSRPLLQKLSLVVDVVTARVHHRGATGVVGKCVRASGGERRWCDLEISWPCERSQASFIESRNFGILFCGITCRCWWMSSLLGYMIKVQGAKYVNECVRPEENAVSAFGRCVGRSRGHRLPLLRVVTLETCCGGKNNGWNVLEVRMGSSHIWQHFKTDINPHEKYATGISYTEKSK